MLYSFVLLISDDMYTYHTAIPALFTHSQVIQVMMPAVLFPREAGIRGLQDVVLALACLLEQLRALVQVVQLGFEAKHLPRERNTSMQLKMMTLLRECQQSMWAHHILLIGEDLERQILIGSRNRPTLVEIGYSGPTLK
jgi:hypothetical protein